MATVIVGGPLFFLFELKHNLETRLWAQKTMPKLVKQLDDVLWTDPAKPEPVKPLEPYPALGLVFGADAGDDGSADDERWRFSTETLLEAELAPATGDRESGTDPVLMHVALSNGVHVLVHGRACDTDSALLRQALFVGGGRDDPTVSVEWVLPQSEVDHPPKGWSGDVLAVIRHTPEQREALRKAIEGLRAQLDALQGAEERGELTKLQEARFDYDVERLRAELAGAEAALQRVEDELGSVA